MFDWPLHSQTSPTSTLVTTTVLLSPATLSVNGPPAFKGLSRTSQRPSLTVVVTVCSWNLTVTFSPSLAVPQTGTATPCCNTAPSENRLLSLTSARAVKAAAASRAVIERADNVRFRVQVFMRGLEA